MDMELNADQNALVDAVSHIVERHLALPKDGNVAAVVHSHYSDALDRDITEGGYLGIAREEGFGPLGAALLVEQVYRAPSVMEVAASAIVVPQLLDDDLPRPVAMMRKQDLSLPVRFLAVARTVLVDLGDDVAIVDVKEGDTEAVKAIFAYPYGQFRQAPDLAKARILKGAGAKLRLWWRVALAVEAAAAMEQAILFTVEYVKNRRQFGRPIGSFQALQHRLAVGIQMAEGAKWLARRAAWSGSEVDAATAALYVQESIAPVCYDLHQFNGALGQTLEHPLHFWTYRMRSLQGELGGTPAQARVLASEIWGVKAA